MTSSTGNYRAQPDAPAAPPETSDVNAEAHLLAELAGSLGLPVQDLLERYGTYTPADWSIVGPACPRDLRWMELRRSSSMEELSDDRSLQAHLVSCV